MDYQMPKFENWQLLENSRNFGNMTRCVGVGCISLSHCHFLILVSLCLTKREPKRNCSPFVCIFLKCRPIFNILLLFNPNLCSTAQSVPTTISTGQMQGWWVHPDDFADSGTVVGEDWGFWAGPNLPEVRPLWHQVKQSLLSWVQPMVEMPQCLCWIHFGRVLIFNKTVHVGFFRLHSATATTDRPLLSLMLSFHDWHILPLWRLPSIVSGRRILPQTTILGSHLYFRHWAKIDISCLLRPPYGREIFQQVNIEQIHCKYCVCDVVMSLGFVGEWKHQAIESSLTTSQRP